MEDPEQLKTNVICESHFAPICLVRPSKLKKSSLPTLNLPNYHEPPTFENCFLLPAPAAKIITPQKIREALQRARTSATALVEAEDLAVKKPTKVYKRKLDFPAKSGTSESDALESGEPGAQAASTSQQQQLPAVPGSSGSLSSRTTSSQRSNAARCLGQHRRIATKGRALEAASTRRTMDFLARNHKMLNFLKDVSDTTFQFFMSQCANQKLKPRGRRFTLNDKIFALSVYKQSGKGYRYLSRVFSLPSKKTLYTILNRVPFHAGINPVLFNHLRRSTRRMKNVDKYCVLMFDEVALDTGLQYNPKRDYIEGFVDLGGSDRRAQFADHALVFLLKGIARKWKQPICFTFCEGTTATPDLKRLIKDVVRNVRSAGLNIVATISDQGSTNSAAIRELRAETNAFCIRNNMDNRYQGYLVDGIEVVHLFDCPHLIKGVRNGLLTKDLHFVEDGVQKVASWSHIVDLYRLDLAQGKYSQFLNLTDEHVLPHKISKMRVRNATQVFSHTVATAMKVRAQTSVELQPTSRFYLDPRASDTADLLFFFDKLFDSVNGSRKTPSSGKELRGLVTSTSPHVSFWHDAIPVLDSMYFTSPDSDRPVMIPSLKNWIFTLQGFLYIWNDLQQKGFKSIAPRAFNQDPVENLFSCIRSHGVRNTNPTCASFITSLKALLINNFVSPHSAGANCEEDESDGLLDTLKSFVLNEDQGGEAELPDVRAPIYADHDVVMQDQNFVYDLATPYVAGVVLKKILKATRCARCRERLQSSGRLAQNALIEMRDARRSLLHPSEIFTWAFQVITEDINALLPNVILQYGVKAKLNHELQNVEIVLPFCSNHTDSVDRFRTVSINIMLYYYIRKLNNILSGKDLRSKDQDPLSKRAFQKFSKRLRRK